MIRDGIVLKPDICISYSGQNNNEQGTIVAKHPFLNINQKNVFEQLDAHVQFWGRMAYGLDLGREWQAGTGAYYLLQTRLMYAVCREAGIKFFAFLQPSIFTKKKFFRKDNETLAWHDVLKNGEAFEYYGEAYVGADEAHRKFHREIDACALSGMDYLYDLRDLFDSYDGMYMDFGHVYSEGNAVIAGRIYELLARNRCFEKAKKEGSVT